jgi:hypothetical protein
MSASETASAESQNRVAIVRFFQYRYAATIITKGNMTFQLPMNVNVLATLTQKLTSPSTAIVKTWSSIDWIHARVSGIAITRYMTPTIAHNTIATSRSCLRYRWFFMGMESLDQCVVEHGHANARRVTLTGTAVERETYFARPTIEVAKTVSPNTDLSRRFRR